MKKELRNTAFALQGFPQTIVSVRDKKGKNNALAVGYVTNVNINPAMMLIGIAPSRYSHHMIKENPCFVIIKDNMIVGMEIIKENGQETWGVIELGYRMPDDTAKPKIPGKIKMTGFTNFCPYVADLDFYKDARAEFTVSEGLRL